MKVVNGALRGFSWVKGFIAGIVWFIALAMIFIIADDDFIIRNTSKGKKKYVI